MTGSAFLDPCVLAEKYRAFYGTSLHRVLTAAAEHLAAQGISVDVPFNTLGPVTLGLYLRKYLLTDNRRMVAGNFDLLAFILQPALIAADLSHFVFANNVSTNVAFVAQQVK